MHAMAEREDQYRLDGTVQLDDAYLGGERGGGTAGRGSENKVPFVAAVSIDPEGHPQYVKLAPVNGFTLEAVGQWAQAALMPGTRVVSDGLGCFAAVTSAGCLHTPIVVGQRKPREFTWVNTVLGNLKTMLSVRSMRSSTPSTPAATWQRSPTASTVGSTCTGWWLGSSSMSRGASLGLSGSFGGMLRIVANQVIRSSTLDC